MKMRLPPFIPWLVIAALADWLITRTLARAAIFIPKSPLMIQVYTASGLVGQVASSLVSLLSMIALAWLAWQYGRERKNLNLAGACLALLLVNLVGLFVPPAGWMVISFQLLMCVAIVALTRQAWEQAFSREHKISVLTTAMTLLAGRLYQGIDSAYAILGLPGPSPASELLFNAGEALVLLAIFALWWAFARQARWSLYLVAAIPALLLAIPRILAPAMTGIMAIWSAGLTLYLPAPAYIAALWLAGFTVLSTLQQGKQWVGWTILLLAAGGYAPQISVHAFLGLIALWLLASAPESQPEQLAAVLEPESAPEMRLYQLDKT
jgi:hypothetical protein